MCLEDLLTSVFNLEMFEKQIVLKSSGPVPHDPRTDTGPRAGGWDH